MTPDTDPGGSTLPPLRPVVLAPLVPAVALLIGVYLPFVNTQRLLLGVPTLFVWTTFWVFMVTVTLLLVERSRPEDEESSR